MTEKEHILTVLAEECGEVAKEVCKSLRFGLDDQVTTDPKGQSVADTSFGGANDSDLS